ncbi:MAG: ABC transporter ATP-binding protein [Alphaproteobacteria bacterium]|nr:ABC transporter ATP-binding protein [Alphaproteobacteria bacterium]
MTLADSPIARAARSGAAGPAPDAAVAVQDLTKVYAAKASGGGRKALDAVDLVVPRGSLFGLLGPNGAGKSTLINILAGLVLKTAGKAWVWGIDIDRDPRTARAAIGVVPQELNIDPFFTPRALLELQAGMYGVPAAERRTMAILSALGLADKAEAYPRTLSGGMRRRLLVAKAMVHAPPVLVLDEPTAGVDIELRQQLWSYVRDLNRDGTTVLLTTHYLEEAEQLCERIAIIDRGRVLCCEAKDALLQRIDAKELTVQLGVDLGAVPGALMPFGATLAGPRKLVIRYKPSAAPVGAILAAIQASGLPVVDVTTSESDLEDVFLQLTRAARDGTR